MDQLSPQLMHKLVFTILMHGLTDNQVALAHKVLNDALTHPSQQVRELAVVALADLPLSSAKRVPGLATALKDESARVRRRAARSLGDQGSAAAAAVPALARGLTDPDASVRRDCAGSLGRIGAAASSCTKPIVMMLADPENRTRAVASVALQRIGQGSIPALLAGVQSPNAEMRGRCATLLGKIAPADEGIELVLQAAMTDEDAEVRARADAALQAVRTPAPVRMAAAQRAELPACA